jgi:hypothetical protein
VSATWRGRLTDGSTAMMRGGPGAGMSTDSVLLAGDRYDVRVRGSGDGRLLVYRPE